MIQPSPAGKRIVFLDSLRAIAVLLVLWGHIAIVGINEPATVGLWVPDVTTWAFGPPVENGIIATWASLNLGLNVGGIGVSLFFIISGFVILRTIDRTRPTPFIVQRFFRIIPTCFFCVVLVASATYAYCLAKGLNQPNTLQSVLTSTFAANYFNSSFSTMPVLWTLEIEMIFYIAMAVSASIFKKLGYKELIFMSLLCLALVSAYSFPTQDAKSKPDILRHFSAIFIHVSYMMIGAIIYRAYEDGTKLRGWAITLVSIAIYVIAYKIYWKATQTYIGSNLPSSATALIIFSAGMFSGMHSKAFSPLRWIAKISYPLYLLHVPLAWGFFYTLASLGLGMYISAILATSAVILLAWGTHYVIERPSQQAGKRISSFFNPKTVLRTGDV
ncbi:acyltransferase family protein [Pseudomonas sp. O64]|uniref:acyltransferase family protein n=1 Tax=unclassified Pseudomonas TaxID=196821 RepID=UPI00387B5BFC